jgi:hypothetical protein
VAHKPERQDALKIGLKNPELVTERDQHVGRKS